MTSRVRPSSQLPALRRPPESGRFARLLGLLRDAPASEEVEAGWRAAAGELRWRVAAGLLVFLAAGVLLLWPTDRLLLANAPELVETFGVWRSVLMVLTALSAAALFASKTLQKRSTPWIAVTLFAAMALSGLLIGRRAGLDSPFPYLSYAYGFVLVPVLMPLRHRATVAVGSHAAFVAGMLWARAEIATTPLFAFFLLAGGAADLANIVFGHIVYRLARENYLQRRVVQEQATALAQAHRQSEELLLNILPASIAARLRERRETIADGFDTATVMFADVCGFTELSARLTPSELVAFLDSVFSDWDERVARRGLEKIKTIGDAYMVAAGVPTPRPDHAEAIAELALELMESLAAHPTPEGVQLQLRIGIHSGPVVAGVIGSRKFSYDLWGDTVNTASRMESHGMPGRIQVSPEARALLDGSFTFEDRGVVQVKGKGPMELALLAGRGRTARK